MSSRRRGQTKGRTLADGYGRPLVAIAGETQLVAGPVQKSVEQAGVADVVYAAAPNRPGGAGDAALRTLLRAACERIAASRRRELDRADRVFAPRYFVLVLTRPGDIDPARRVFGVAPWYCRLAPEGQTATATWRQERIAFLVNRIRDAVEMLPRAELSEKIQNQYRNAAVALPSRNYFIERDEALVDWLVRLQDGALGVTDIEQRVRRVRDPGRGRRAYAVDVRGRRFQSDPSMHGRLHLHVSRGESIDAGRQLLERLYRLGYPLRDGFHHDVSPRDGGPFRQESFVCCESGHVEVSCDHVNIYPNDRVRSE